MAYIDAHYRTIADREHRATAGLSLGGFMSFWVAGKYPHLVGSASSFMSSSEFFVGPRGFPVEYRDDEMHNNYEGVRTRLVVGTEDFIRFYQAPRNASATMTIAHGGSGWHMRFSTISAGRSHLTRCQKRYTRKPP